MSLRVEGGGGELSLRSAETSDPRRTAAADGAARSADDEPGFAALLESQVAEASRLQTTATHKAEALARGANDDLHGTMISMKEAEISMKLVGAVRNKLLDAFHELWRINL